MAINDIKAQRQNFFTAKRNEAQQQTTQMQQQGEDAINRRFAALGASGSGAAISANLKNQEQAQAAQRSLLNDVNTQELQANENQNQMDQQRQFQVEDLNKQQNFQRELSTQDFGFKNKLADTEQGNKLKELDLAERQFLLDKDTTEFNKNIAKGGVQKDTYDMIMADRLNQYQNKKNNPTAQPTDDLSDPVKMPPKIDRTVQIYDVKTKKFIRNPNYGKPI